MLTNIKIVNINSIGTCEIDFSKDKYKYLEDNLLGDYVNPIALYGHNGSGKTSLLKAIGQFISLLINPVDNLDPFIVNQFSLNKYVNDEKNGIQNISDITGSIELHFTLNNIKYEYYISTSRLRRIEKEYLKSDVTIFSRDVTSETFMGKTQKFSDLRSLLVPSIRYLAAEKINNNDIQNVYKFLISFTFIDLPYQHAGAFVTSKLFNNMSRADLIVSKSEEVKKILMDYKEFPIYSVLKKESHDVSVPAGYYIKYDGIDGEIPFDLISAGMLNQSTILSILVSLPDDSVLFVNELEQSLHPSAIMSFLKVIKKKKIQLVFSSHNTYILQSMRPDQIYFANWKNCSSSYSRLSRIYPNIREINNIEKMYLSSLFDEAIKNVW